MSPDEELRRAQRASMTRIEERLGLSFSRGDIEMRAKPDGTGGSAYEWDGYASVYDAPFQMHDRLGEPFMESVAQGACKRSLANPNLDVPFVFGHSEYGIPFARTSAGTMRLSEDSHGLHVHVPAMDGRREDVRALASAVERGDVSEMSLAFVCNRQEWDTAYEHRTVCEMDLHRGDVSAVVHGANPQTAGVWMGAVEQLRFRRPAAIGGPVLLERRAAHAPFKGTHTHAHPAMGSQGGDGTHEHEHSHDGDADHSHAHEGRASARPGERRASAADNMQLGFASDYNGADSPHQYDGTHQHDGADCSYQCAPHQHSHSAGMSANVMVDDSTGIPGEETQFSAARRLELRLRELELEELAVR